MQSKRRSLVPILWIWLVAGTLDITENLVFTQLRGISPWRVFQYIASGLIGVKSFRIGWNSVALGFALHYGIALAWTVIFYFAARRFAGLMRRPFVSGLIYGCLVYVIMNFVVLPFSGVPRPVAAITIVSRVNAVLALIFCIGLPISFLTRKALARV